MLGQSGDEIAGALMRLVSLGLYLLPTIVAGWRRVPNAGSILLVNLLLGWTVIGWIAALAMAAKPRSPSVPIADPRTVPRAPVPRPPVDSVPSGPSDEQRAIDYAADLLFEAHARGMIDEATRARLEELLNERRAAGRVSPTAHVAPPPLPAQRVTSPVPPGPVPPLPSQIPVWGDAAAGSVPAAEVRASAPVREEPARAPGWLERARAVVVSDLAVHGLVYLGVLFLFIGTLGFLLFSFRSIQVGLRPVAEFALPGALLGSAWFLRRRGAPFVATALGLLGGLLLPMFVFASFVDGVSFPPELDGSALVAALIATSAAIGLGYAAYSVRVPQASLKYLVSPMAWFAAWAAGFLVVTREDGEIELASWSARQLAITTLAIAITVVLARLVPRGRFSRPTLVAAIPGLAGAYALTIVLAGSEGWPTAPILIAGLAALVTIEFEAPPLARDASSVLQAAVLGVSAVALGEPLGPGWGGSAAVVGFVALLEWHLRRGAKTPTVLADAAGVMAGLGLAFVEPWSATVAFAVASVWAHARRLRPPHLPGVAVALDLAAGLLPVGFAVGLVWALPDGDAIVWLAAGVAVGSVAVRLWRREDGFYLLWTPAVAGAVALATLVPSLPVRQAAAAAAVCAFALAILPRLPVVRVWSSAPVLAWAVWLTMQAAGLSGVQRSIGWSIGGAALVAAGSLVRSPLGGHAAAVGTIAILGGLGSSADDRSRTVAHAAWTGAWLMTLAMGEIRRGGLAPLLVRAAGRIRVRWVQRLALLVPPVVLLASAPLLVAELGELSGITVGRRSWTGVAMSATAVAYALVARMLAGRRPLASVAAIAAFVLAAIGISVSAPDPWPSIVSVAGLTALPLCVGRALRPPLMTWTAWASSGALLVLLAGRAGVSTQDLPIVIAAWGVALLIGGLLEDDRRAGRRGAGEGIRTPWLWPPVALGALGSPVGLAFAFPQGPDVYGPWSIAAAGVYLGVALLVRAGAVSVVSWALLTTGVAAMIPWSAIERPWLFVPWGAVLAFAGVALGLGKGPRDGWARWDLPPLLVAHVVAAIGLVRSLDVGWVIETWGGFGAIALVLALSARSAVWGVAAMILLDVAAGAAGPGWLALALAISACGAFVVASRLAPPLRWAVQATGATLVAAAWWQLAGWTGWSTTEAAFATAGAASVLVIAAGAWVWWGRAVTDWSFTLAGLGLLGGAAAIGLVVWPSLPGAGRVGTAWVVASVTGSWALSLGTSARRFELLPLREGSAALAAATLVVLAVGYEVEVGPAVAAAATLGLAATAGSMVLWRVRHGSAWLPPLGVVAGLSDIAGAALAVTAPDRHDLLIAMLLVSSVESAAAGVVMRRAWLLGLAPIFASAAWLLFAADALRGEVQWFTTPIGFAMLLEVAVVRWSRPDDRAEPGAIVVLEFVGMALVVGASIVQIIMVGPASGLVALVAGAGIAVWGGVTRVRRRLFFGAGAVVVSLLLMVAAPVARLVPTDATAIWIVLLVAGAVLVAIATMIERFRSGVARLIGRLETLMEGWR